MKMRKWYIALITLLALTACQQEPVLPEGGNGGGNSFDVSTLRFNLTIEHPDGANTKGVKKAWKNGDKVFLFIPGITDGYLTATLNVSTWETAYVGTDLASLGDSGTLQAVYLPYGNDATPSFSDGKWSFSGGTGGMDTYYFYASNVSYSVSGGILSATVQMVKPMDYVQFFIPRANASGTTIQLACNGLRPSGFASIAAADGTVTEIPLESAGTAIHGYPDTLEGEEGYYVSGKPTTVPDNDYYFALKKADYTYAHFFQHRTSAIANNKAYQLPAYTSWHSVGGSYSVQIGDNKWKTVNEGAEHPWTMGDLTASFDPEDGEGLPSVSNWTDLLDPNVASWKEMDIMGQNGYLVVSVTPPTSYIFLPWSTSSETDYWIDGSSSVFRIATDGTQTNGQTPVPAQAYTRLIESLSYFKIRAKEGGTTMTFKYTDGSILYNAGGSWQPYTGQEFHLSADEEVWFRNNPDPNAPTRTDCNCTGNTQLFTADKVCYIAGDIASLLEDPSTLPTNAFRSAFSRKTTVDNGNNGSDTEKPSGITVSQNNPSDYVNWVDIDPGDPLILPATTATNCYMDMFLGCISLTTAPELPATELADKCYYRMFHSCFGLTSIPSLPSVVTMSGSTTRRRYFYQMFQYCTSITTLTEPLPVGQGSTLQRGCFEDMFAHCTGLTSVAKGLLPATTLARDCYRGMFQDTRFERAPDLLVTELVPECYRYMFNACTNLKYIKCLATTNIGNGYTTNWVSNNGNKNVPNTNACEFVGADETILPTITWPRDYHGILSNWKVTPVSQEQTP